MTSAEYFFAGLPNGDNFFKEMANLPFNKEHEHEFTIPVEWSATPNEYTTASLSLVSVTKLRCVCGEEVKR